MRESNFHFPSANKACVSITPALYDRRALDCTADLPLVNSLVYLNQLTMSSARIREILTTDGGLERLVRILRTTRVIEDTLHNWKWVTAFQCVVNVGVRGTAEIRQRVVQVGALPILVEVLRAYLLGAEVLRLEHRVREAMAAQSERLPLAKLMDFAVNPAMPRVEEHAEISDPSSTVMSDNILASGANNSTGASPSPSRSMPAAARNSAQAAAAAAVAAATGMNPIPVTVSAMLPPAAAAASAAAAAAAAAAGPNRQQTRRVGEGTHPLAQHVAYPDAAAPLMAAAPAVGGMHAAMSGQLLPYNNHAYMYSEQERLQAEYEAARRRLQSITNVMYRHDDVVLALQLLAYLSKTPAQRQLLRACPLLGAQFRPAGARGHAATDQASSDEWAVPTDLDDAALAAQCALRASTAAGIPPVRRRPGMGSASVDVFAMVERFTEQKMFPPSMVHWSAIVMRNGCRRDESRSNCRQCAYLKCQRWESHSNEFSKCRRCRKAKYCSKECQSNAWQEGHRYWCTERNPPDANAPTPMDGGTPMASGLASVDLAQFHEHEHEQEHEHEHEQPQQPQYQPQPPTQFQQQQQPQFPQQQQPQFLQQQFPQQQQHYMYGSPQQPMPMGVQPVAATAAETPHPFEHPAAQRHATLQPGTMYTATHAGGSGDNPVSTSAAVPVGAYSPASQAAAAPAAGWADHRQPAGGPVASAPHANHLHHPYWPAHAESQMQPPARSHSRPRRSGAGPQ